MGSCILFWVPAQYMQFMLVPMKYKVPFICLAAFLWNVILSAVVGSVARWRKMSLQGHVQLDVHKVHELHGLSEHEPKPLPIIRHAHP